MEKAMLISSAVFVLTYAILMAEKFSRAVVTMLGAILLVFLGVVTQEELIEGVDFNTLGLLIGMMTIVLISQKTGMFQYLAIRSAKIVKGEPWWVLVSLGAVTAVLSALLDNVTTVLLTVPVTILIADELKLSPYPFLVFQIFASNIGGAATLIGDPPNILIGSAVGLTFLDFVLNVGPIVPFVFIVTLIPFKLVYGRKLKVAAEQKARIMEFREDEAIKDVPLLKKSLFVLGLVTLGFIFHGQLHLEAATIALFGAALLMLIAKEDFHGIMEGVEWTTIFFFVGLFGIVAGLEKTGVIESLADWMIAVTGGEIVTTTMAVLWLSAIASSIVDNIPFVATMIPMIKEMAQSMGGEEAIMPLWWALSLGACLGGNGSIIGASANVIVAGISERSGYPISFFKFLIVAFPMMLLSIIISTVYLYLRYLI